MDFSQIVQPIKTVLEKYKDNKDFLEIEGRLGIYDSDNKNFDSNIGEEYYNTIKNLLDSCPEWSETEKSHITDYFCGSLRLSIDDQGSQRCIEKLKPDRYTFINESGPLDFRLSISKENPQKVSKFPSDRSKLKSREKIRNTYYIDNYKFDLTKVISKENKEIEEYFEFEVEYTGEFQESTDEIVQHIVVKLLDGSFACENFIKTKYNTLPLEKVNLLAV